MCKNVLRVKELKTRDATTDRKTATRADLLDAIYVSATTMSRKDTRAVFETIFDEVSKALADNEPIKLRGFGSFSVRSKKKRIGRNPRTGTEVEITPRRVMTFKPSPVLIAAMNKPPAKDE
jgi:integration host factor subunit alpha